MDELLVEKKIALFGVGGAIWKFFLEVLGKNPFFQAMTLFWFLDMLLGTCRAVATKKYSNKKFLFGLIKWLVGTTVIFVAWGFRLAPPPEDDFIAFMMEYSVLFMFGHSVLKNANLLFKMIGSGESTLLDKVLGVAEENANDILDRFRPNHNHEDPEIKKEEEDEKIRP